MACSHRRLVTAQPRMPFRHAGLRCVSVCGGQAGMWRPLGFWGSPAERAACIGGYVGACLQSAAVGVCGQSSVGPVRCSVEFPWVARYSRVSCAVTIGTRRSYSA